LETAVVSLASVVTVFPPTTFTPEIFTTLVVIGEPSRLVTVTGESVMGDTLVEFPQMGTAEMTLPMGTVEIGVLVELVVIGTVVMGLSDMVVIGDEVFATTV